MMRSPRPSTDCRLAGGLELSGVLAILGWGGPVSDLQRLRTVSIRKLDTWNRSKATPCSMTGALPIR
jgi:hypothetical protein